MKQGRLTIESVKDSIASCRCDCGKALLVPTARLNRRIRPTRSCGCLQREMASIAASARSAQPRNDLTGLQINKLTVLRLAEPEITDSGKRRLRWYCECVCGNIVSFRAAFLKCPRPPKTCGCGTGKPSRQHKPAKPRIKPVQPKKHRKKVEQLEKKIIDPTWLKSQYDEIDRKCNDPTHPHYMRFGGDGVELYWNDFKSFSDWVVRNIGLKEKQIVRMNRYLGFEPNNIKWAEF